MTDVRTSHHHLLSRRNFLITTGTGAANLLSPPAFVAGSEPELLVTGKANPVLAPFDQLMTSFVTQHKVPGAALAVTRQGKLVYARGFGFADVEAKSPVEPAAFFRIASVSKPITAVAVMWLVEQGRVKLDDKVVDRMQLAPHVESGVEPDKRWQQITVRQCLQHTGGWDRDKSGDPIGRARHIAHAVGAPSPARPVDIVRYMMGQPLDFDPGARHVYSNLGYLVLGRIIEKITGEDYDAFVKKEVLTPLGIKSARLGHARLEDRVKGEVKYYESQNRTGESLYPPHAVVPVQYGADNLEGYEAHGGWIASTVELVRFATAFDRPEKLRLLKPATIDQMFARPDGPAGHEADGKPKDAYYACGWSVRPIGNTGKSNQWHSGFIAGSEALLVRRLDGLNWAVLFNTALAPDGKQRLVGLIDSLVHKAADQVKQWPTADQFGRLLT